MMNTPLIDEMIKNIMDSRYPPGTPDMLMDMIHDTLPYEYSDDLLYELNCCGESKDVAQSALIEALYQTTIIAI